MYEVNVKIKGLVSVLMNKYIMPKRQGAPSGAYKGFDDVQLELAKIAHMDEKGLYAPTDSIRMMLIGNQLKTGAAKILGSRIEKGKGANYTDACEAGVWVIGPEDPEKVYYKPQRKIWDDVDIRSFITSTKARDVKSRPMIKPPWTLEFNVLVTADELKPGKVKELFEVAGLRCGIGSYGPTFGRFQVVRWKKK